ncbi:hypothetical protein R6242_18755 [Iodobacter sp. CM08]|uniref:hypothetical protein n=1 Tax=Iodobacter sp. CM08 TaxID=3085902 RepID=UPI002982A09D|nr:hypothetical protein [Iodobacter sp. CM08]MDW5418609.1 hypothetical protein [Iodobacter sp. CM08]
MSGSNKIINVTNPADLFKAAQQMTAQRNASRAIKPGEGNTVPTISHVDRSQLRSDAIGNIGFGVFDTASVSHINENGDSSRSITQGARVNAAAVYASTLLVQALMAYPGVKGGGTEQEDEIIDDILKRAIAATDRIVLALGLTEAHPRFDGHKNRIFKEQLDLLSRAHIARYVHEFGADDVAELANLQVRLAEKIDKSTGLSAEGDVSYLDAAIDVAIAKNLAMVDVAATIIDEIGRCRFNFGVKDPVLSIALPAAEHAAEAVEAASRLILGDDYGKNRINDGMVEMALISSAAKIYRTSFTNEARQLIDRIDQMDEVERATEFNKYLSDNGAGWPGFPTSGIHQQFDRYFSAVINFVAVPEASRKTSKNDTTNNLEID